MQENEEGYGMSYILVKWVKYSTCTFMCFSLKKRDVVGAEI